MTQSEFRTAVFSLPRGVLTPTAYTSLLRIATGEDEPNAYWIGKLQEGLKKAAKQGMFKTSEMPSPEPSPLGEEITTDKDGKISLPQARPLHKQHSHFHALMVETSRKDPANRPALAELASKIMDISIKLDAMYDAARDGKPIPTFREEKDPDGPMSEADILRRILYLNSRISALKNHLIPNAKNNERRAALEKELAEKTAEKQGYESQ